MPTRDQLEIAVTAACDRLAVTDSILFQRKVNERSLSHKFAIYLQQEVDKWNEGWDVDTEFNRDAKNSGEDYAKQLNLIDKLDSWTASVDDENATTVFPDVIVHKRGLSNNLLVIEMKKDSATAKSIAFDKNDKLPAYVRQLGYQSAAFILLRLDHVDCKIEWVKQLA